MARWRLLQPHYINIQSIDGQPIEWDYEETSRETGRKVRRRFPVPMLLDPSDRSYQNYPDEIIVCHEGKGQPRDYVFFGPPTPEMEPLDKEAEDITNAERPKWVHPMGEQALPGQFGEQLLQKLTRQLEDVIRTNGIPKAEALPGTQAVDQGEVGELRAQVASLQKMVEQLLAGQMGIKPQADTEEPLPDVTPEEIVAEVEGRVERRV